MMLGAIPFVICRKSSALWVISICPPFVGHLSGHTAARADRAAEQNEKKSRRIKKRAERHWLVGCP
ncbi:hypothetical protein AAH450_11560 [Erwinia sp. P7711]|uniref:hypothetical protein n=1 Tax=Erwinia sp. P7711 TaxID=3141451 RepID=UPI003191F937